MLRYIELLMVLILVIPVTAQAGITLARQGRSRYSIVIAPDASATVQHAANELSADLQEISGASFPVISQASTGPAIFVGKSDAMFAQFPNIILDNLPEEGFVIQSNEKDLVLTGNDDRGTLYSVYTFLEEHLGVRWFAPDDTVMPRHRTIRIPTLHERQAPAFMYRDTDEHLVFTSAQWDAHLKLDGVSVPDQADLGGINRLFNGAENFYQLVPPSQYFATHPEYFSLINGKRSDAGDSQLCLSNPDVFRIIVDQLTAQAQADPKLLTLGLSPNDAPDGSCQGVRCRAKDAKYGAPSGTLLDFVNKVAAAVQEQLPGRKIWVETLAYQYTEKPPTPGTIQPAPNVLVCLAPIHMDDGHSIATEPINQEAKENLLGWGKVAPGHLQVWHYVTNFAHYLQPFPDWDELGADMAYYRDHGVSGMFCEGDYNSEGEMMAMRTWVLAHLMWNPDQDVWQLVKEFSDGYYGKAGPYIYQYLRLLHDQLQKPNVHLYIYDSPNAAYLSPTVITEAGKLFAKAKKAVADNPDQLNRVREAELGIQYVELMRSVPNAQSTAAQKSSFLNELNQFVAKLQPFNIDYISEGRPVSNWVTAMKNAAK